MPRGRIAQRLSGGDRRSLGSSDSIADELIRNPSLASELVRCLWSDDECVRMRAADALEKASLKTPQILQHFKPELLRLAAQEQQKEVRWHLAQMVPRLSLNARERQRAITAFREYLNDSSSIVKTFAMQALADLAGEDSDARSEVTDLLRVLSRSGTPAMRARGRKLLARLEKKS